MSWAVCGLTGRCTVLRGFGLLHLCISFHTYSLAVDEILGLLNPIAVAQ